MFLQIHNSILLISSVISSIVYLFFLKYHNLNYKWVPKGLSTALLCIYCYFNCIELIALSICAAVFFSCIGDIFLALKNEKYFMYGLISFLIAHILFSKAFYSNFNTQALIQGEHIFIFISLIIYSIFILKILSPKLGKFKIPVYIYICALIIMGFGSIYSIYSNICLIFGILFFIISDSLLAIQKFIRTYKGLNYAIWSTYYIAQLLIIYSLNKKY